MKQAVDGRDWIEAGNQMMDSRWYKQVTTRADRLIKKIRSYHLVRWLSVYLAIE